MSSWYTAFAFKGYSPYARHCTHKYIGKVLSQPQQSTMLHGCIRTIQHFQKLRVTYISSPWVFNLPDTFDEGQLVMLPDQKTADQINQFNGLRILLDQALNIKDTYANYRPHVSVLEQEVLKLLPDRYVLMNGTQVVSQWSLGVKA